MSSDEAEVIEKPVDEQHQRVRASKLEYKTINQVWDKHGYGLKLVERLDDAEDEDLYEEYIFIERRKYDDQNMRYSTFVDVKSEPLSDVLRKVLEGVSTVSIHGDKPEICIRTLYHYLAQLETSRENSGVVTEEAKPHLDLLIRYLHTYFESILRTLPRLLKHGEITYDLLWALFPPMTTVYSVCDDSEQERCTVLDSIQEMETMSKEKYFHLSTYFIDYNGTKFGKVFQGLKIPEFTGVKRIQSLDAFPLIYHEKVAEVKLALINRGRRYVSLPAVHHCSYSGLAHVKRPHPEKTLKVSTKGRLMVDPLSFKEKNPSYFSPRRGVRAQPVQGLPMDFEGTPDIVRDSSNTTSIPRFDVNFRPETLEDEEYVICSPTVFGFSLDKRVWAEFAVSCIEDIQWTSLPFDTLVIPQKKKNMLQALVQEQMIDPQKAYFDDVVEGKGKGLIVLLHGPPGVGKTLTAEAISEHRHRPLYRVTAGELGLDATKLEESLSQLLDLVARWKAILLLDEADVFLETRERQHLQHNTLVSVFLRQLEYFQGVMILTTNRVTAFDDAVQSRIHLGIKYEALSEKAKEEIWRTFIKQAQPASIESVESTLTARATKYLASKDFNGRQIKNTVRMACALAVAEHRPLKYKDLTDAIEANADFDDDFRGAGRSEAMRAYQ